jgi:hypothetical protein
MKSSTSAVVRVKRTPGHGKEEDSRCGDAGWEAENVPRTQVSGRSSDSRMTKSSTVPISWTTRIAVAVGFLDTRGQVAGCDMFTMRYCDHDSRAERRALSSYNLAYTVYRCSLSHQNENRT